ncbi:uncharacterized protein LOC113273110 [Papaver somniferum]|uniref:uncharacterized protein LOC113273110 n=1 Tax=Papaver somniferum TaxID=3469 RepID=UPI000E6FA5BE|nr:uncharacterized protein LOC113273110 [Papaver somniferum]
MGDAIGRAIKVDDTTLKREVGYYANVLVEVDLARSVPHQVVVNSKYGSFEQEVQIPKLPKFCSHCKVVGHLVTECRVMRKESAQKVEENDTYYAIPKKVWKIKERTVPQPIGKFRILQNLMNDDFPPISVNKLLDVASSSSYVVNYVIVENKNELAVKEVVKKIIKPKPISLISTRKQNAAMNLVKEKKGTRSPVSSQSTISK